ncbi:hypothetical protein [Pseudomonas aeruginosa]
MGFRAYVGFWFHCSPNPYRDRRYYRRAGYRDGYYRHDNGHHYGQYKKWKRHKHHRRYYDD